MKTLEDFVFISYARNDSLLAEELAIILKNENIKVRLAKNDVDIGSDIKESINTALEKANSIIILISKYAFNSNWVRKEFEYVIFNEKYKDRILPVVIGNITTDEFKNVPWVIKKTSFLQIQEGDVIETAKIIANSYKKMIKL